jgi:hypothetical protein
MKTKLNTRLAILLSAALLPCCTQAAFQLLENFELELGDLNGQNGWVANGGVVALDPDNPDNRVGAWVGGSGDRGSWKAATIANNTTGTLFFRLRVGSDNLDGPVLNWSVGMSDIALTGQGGFGDYQAQINQNRDAGNDFPNQVRSRNAGAFDTLADLQGGQWYNFWMVINNAANTYRVYMQGGQLPTQTLLQNAGGVTDFVFRNAGTRPDTDLIYLFIRMPGSHVESLHVDDFWLDPTGVNLADPSTPPGAFVSGFSSSLTGFTYRLSDGTDTMVDPNSIELRLNGGVVTPQVSKAGPITTIAYTPAAFFPPESTHVASLTFGDTGTPPAVQVVERPFTIAYYGVIPASYALATPPTNPGWVVSRVHQIEAARGPGDGNSTANAEMQLADGMVDATGNPRPNIAEFPGPLNIGGDPSIDIWWTPYVNWERAGGQINATGAQPDNFNTVEPPGEPGTAAGAYSNYFTPGVELGSTAEPENYVVETVAYIQLAAGLHRWGVNSDDGFKVTVAPGQPSPLGITLGEFSGGRGATDTLFDFVVEQAGFYPIRLLYWQGGGGASAEWFSVDLATGQKILIGDTQYYPTRAYPAFRNGQGRARVSTLRPSSGFTGTQPTGPIFAQITDGRTTASNARLLINGQQVATGTKAGTVTTINYTPETPLALGTTFSGQIVYDESGQAEPITHNFTFTTRILQLVDLPADSFWIEAEDFDYGNGQSVPAASTMPYAGGAYQGLNPVLNVDYLDTEMGQFTDGAFTDGVSNYRGDSRTGANPILSNISNETGGNLAMSRPGGFTMTTNYKIGWVGGADWWNYTRNIPAGNYRAMAAQSIDGGTGNLMTSTLHRVTSGAGTANQTTALLGTFRGTGSTGWSQNALIPLLTSNSEGAPAAILQLPGGPVTLRWQGGAGDLDWMVLIPTTDLPPVDDLEITSITIGTDGRIRIAWEGTGTLQSTADLPASTWSDITGTSPVEIDPPASGRAFYRVRQ